MGHFSMKISAPTGSILGGTQHHWIIATSGDQLFDFGRGKRSGLARRASKLTSDAPQRVANFRMASRPFLICQAMGAMQSGKTAGQHAAGMGGGNGSQIG